ncbi:MAG: hypothetical protein ACRD2C_20760 [Acidimicrobiales bacterium]
MAALEQTGWQQLTPKRSGAAAFVVTPFARLARTHATAVAGDTLIAMALAGSLFFSIDPSQAKSKVALYLALTMAPFSLVAPLIGPWLDRVRGGRRWVAVGANALRAGICLLMIRDLDRLYLFPEAFGVLVLSKSYHVAKSALVPTVVANDDELVAANSRLSLLSGVMSLVAAIPGGVAILVADSEGVLVLACVAFALAAGLATKIPATRVAPEREDTLERRELRGGGIVLAASAMGLLRGIVGFMTFLLAFELRSDDAETWKFGLVLGASAVGALAGAAVAPRMREAGLVEERILQVVLGLTVVSGVASAFAGSLVGPPLLAATVGLAASSGKLAFDAIVQRDAPDANRGRSFARFETRFQLIWVIGAFIPVMISIPAWIGFLAVAGCAAFALLTYLASLRAVARGEEPKSYSHVARSLGGRWRGVSFRR